MTPRIENEARIDVLLELDVLRHTLPILVADAQKATSIKLDADPVCARLKEARDAVADLIALVGAMVETDRLVGRDDIANLFWPAFVEDAKKALANCGVTR